MPLQDIEISMQIKLCMLVCVCMCVGIRVCLQGLPMHFDKARGTAGCRWGGMQLHSESETRLERWIVSVRSHPWFKKLARPPLPGSEDCSAALAQLDIKSLPSKASSLKGGSKWCFITQVDTQWLIHVTPKSGPSSTQAEQRFHTSHPSSPSPSSPLFTKA